MGCFFFSFQTHSSNKVTQTRQKQAIASSDLFTFVDTDPSRGGGGSQHPYLSACDHHKGPVTPSSTENSSSFTVATTLNLTNAPWGLESKEMSLQNKQQKKTASIICTLMWKVFSSSTRRMNEKSRHWRQALYPMARVFTRPQ